MNNRRSEKTTAASELPQPSIFSIANQLRFGVFALVGVSLLFTAMVLIILAYQAQLQHLEVAQRELSRAAAGEINAYLDDLQRKLAYLARVRGLTDRSGEVQQTLLEGLTRHNDAYETVALLDNTGRVIKVTSSHNRFDLGENLADSPIFLRAFRQQEDYIGPVELDPDLGQLVTILAVPIRNQQDKVAGVLLAEINLRFLSFVVSQTRVGETGYVYVIDNRNFLVAGKGSGVEPFELRDVANEPFIQGLTSGALDASKPYDGLNGQEVLGAIAPVRSVRWNVIVELPTAEANAPIIEMLWVMGGALALATLITVGAGIYFSRQIVLPLQRLTEASAQISAGNMDTQVNVSSQNEMGVLATTFNKMTSQLKDLYTTLEQRVANRTERLEIVATLSEQLSGILKLEDLLAQVVNQIKDRFDYYHAHIYLLDDTGQNLVVAEGVGEAGAVMKAKRHSIPLNAQTSLVARAARTAEIVTVDNVREAEDWLPNPLLPNTYSEMAVPIVLEGRVVGVLDVQQDRLAGLDEADASLLRSLVNQVAVAIRNARLFDEVETALAEAYAAQERYTEQSWEKAKILVRQGQHHYARPDAANLSEDQKQALTEARHQVLQQGQMAKISVNGDQATATAVISPVILHNKAIGVLQIYPADKNQAWTEDDLAIIEAVSDELAQTAESLRLFEETRRRAGQEQIIRQVADRLRSASNMEQLITIATEEIVGRLSPTHARLKLGVEPQQAKTNGSNR
ncbi:MAG: GAF domain-containing protein [Anaerolineales bacterium]|nr:GAF domain-containing protein [Anaerolineales bacterium]